MGRTALVVDDQAASRRVAKALLQAAGFTVVGEAVEARCDRRRRRAPPRRGAPRRAASRNAERARRRSHAPRGARRVGGDPHVTADHEPAARTCGAAFIAKVEPRPRPSSPPWGGRDPAGLGGDRCARRAACAVVTVREQVIVGRSTTFVLTEAAVGLIIVGAGLVVRERRPANRCWVLLVGAGFAWYVGVVEPAANEDVSLVAFAFGKWYELLLLGALLAYPIGRLTGRVDRAIVAAAAALLALRTLGRLLLHVAADFTGCDCVQNRFLPITDDRWWRLTERVYEIGLPIVMAAALVRVAQVWRRSSAPGRRMLSPALAAGTALALAVTTEHVAGWNATLPRSGISSYGAVAWSHALVACALAFGSARLRATRSAVVDLVADLHADGPFRLGDAIGAALGDPAMRLVPWSAEHGAYVDRAGVAVDVDTVGDARTVTRIDRDGLPIAALIHDVTLLEDPGWSMRWRRRSV